MDLPEVKIDLDDCRAGLKQEADQPDGAILDVDCSSAGILCGRTCQWQVPPPEYYAAELANGCRAGSSKFQLVPGQDTRSLGVWNFKSPWTREFGFWNFTPSVQSPARGLFGFACDG